MIQSIRVSLQRPTGTLTSLFTFTIVAGFIAATPIKKTLIDTPANSGHHVPKVQR